MRRASTMTSDLCESKALNDLPAELEQPHQTGSYSGDRPLRKYDWLQAAGLFPGFKDSPKVLRVCIAIHGYVNEDLGYAWPSRRTLSEQLRISETAVSQAITVLKNASAINTHRIADLPEEVRRKMKRFSPRSQCYSLNMDWARWVLDDYGKKDKK